MWEKELELVECLGKLYPRFYYFTFKEYQKNNNTKARWVYYLCICHLDQRILRLEEFIKENTVWPWKWYKDWFGITDEQCGKKS